MRLKAPNYDCALAEHDSTHGPLRSTWICNQITSGICSILAEKGLSCKHAEMCSYSTEQLLTLSPVLKFLFACGWIKHKAGHSMWTINSMLKTKTNSTGMGWNICWSIFVSQTQVIYFTDLHHKGVTILYLRSPQRNKKNVIRIFLY